MRILAWGLVIGFLLLALFTIHYGVHTRGRNIFVSVLYIMAFLYTVDVGIYYIINMPPEFLGGRTISSCLYAFGIFSLGLFILCYIGWSRIPKVKPWLHLFYVSTLTSIPNLTFTLNFMQGEALSTLVGAICFLGFIRLCEKKYNLPTLVLLLPLPYYIWTLITATRSFTEFTVNAQSSLEYHFTPMVLAFQILWFTPILFIIPSIRKYGNSLSKAIVIGWMLIIGLFCYQLQFGFNPLLITWHFGNYMATHFLPFQGIFALSGVFVAESLITENGFDPETTITTIDGDLKKFSIKLIYNHIVYLLILGFSFVLFYGNFPYFLHHFKA